jgi:hypothetical protein
LTSLLIELIDPSRGLTHSYPRYKIAPMMNAISSLM